MILPRSQIDGLGDRLRLNAPPTEDDLRLLEVHRLSYTPPYEVVVDTIRNQLQLNPVGRPGKTTGSIIAKLRRQSIRLSQIQDIAGCRLVELGGLPGQDRIVEQLIGVFPGCRAFDRRRKPSHGYRAVHLVVTAEQMPVEIQVRTNVQHFWAEVCEKLADQFGQDVKYGGGEPAIQAALLTLSKVIEEVELQARDTMNDQEQIADLRRRLNVIGLLSDQEAG